MALGEEQRETEFARALREGEFVVSVQLDPPLGGSAAGLLEVAHELTRGRRPLRRRQRQRDRARRDELADGLGAIERATGLETIPHLTTRDWTVLGLESMLLGAHAEGVRNVLAITGDPPEVGDYPGSRGVYEIDAIGLTQLITRLNRGEDFNGRPIDAPTSFFVGVAVNPTADDLEVEAERFRQKVEAGREVRDDADRLRPRRRSTASPRCSAALADPGARRDLPADELPARAAAAQRGAGDRRPAGSSRTRSRDAGAERGRGRDGARAELVAEARGRCEGVYVVAPYRRPGARARAARLAAAGRDRAASRARARAGRRRRDAVARLRADARCEDRRLDLSPSRLTAGPPELPWRTSPLRAVTSRSELSTSTSAVLPIRPARASNGPFSG